MMSSIRSTHGKSVRTYAAIAVLLTAVGLVGTMAGCAKSTADAKYLLAKERINEVYKRAADACGQLADDAKAACVNQANGDQSVALAELDAHSR